LPAPYQEKRSAFPGEGKKKKIASGSPACGGKEKRGKGGHGLAGAPAACRAGENDLYIPPEREMPPMPSEREEKGGVQGFIPPSASGFPKKKTRLFVRKKEKRGSARGWPPPTSQKKRAQTLCHSSQKEKYTGLSGGKKRGRGSRPSGMTWRGYL